MGKKSKTARRYHQIIATNAKSTRNARESNRRARVAGYGKGGVTCKPKYNSEKEKLPHTGGRKPYIPSIEAQKKNTAYFKHTHGILNVIELGNLGHVPGAIHLRLGPSTS